MIELSIEEARRLALVAQGFAEPRPKTVGKKDLRALVERLGVVQIDSVNVLVRSHYLPAWSRLGAYDHAALDALSHDAPRALFEYWGHEASLLPVALYPLMRWRMALAHEHAWGRMRRIAKRQQQLVADVLAFVGERGPVAGSELTSLGKPRAPRSGGWWGWSEAKTALEWLFWCGEITSARRKGFERQYDLVSRVLPPAILGKPAAAHDDAHDQLVARSARALGVATEADLRDYYRLALASTRASIARLVERGELEPARVEGWTKPAYVLRGTPAPPARIDATALLSPFDSLIWARERTERLFGMKVRLEVYTPAHKRVHGYYVLPLLHGEQLVGRVDLKADRAAGVLRAQAAHAEVTGAKAKAAVAAAMAGELERMAPWLGLERAQATGDGDLGKALARALA